MTSKLKPAERGYRENYRHESAFKGICRCPAIIGKPGRVGYYWKAEFTCFFEVAAGFPSVKPAVDFSRSGGCLKVGQMVNSLCCR